MAKSLRIRDRGVVMNRHAADAMLERPGDFVLVYRGVARSFVMLCPDGCGEKLTINLDPRTDKAWRFYRKRNQISVFPSVWRDTGCKSHFIIWNHSIVLCNSAGDDEHVTVEDEVALRERVLALCTHDWQHFAELAEQLQEVPWDVHRVCRDLVFKSGALIQGKNELRGSFRLAAPCRND